MKLLSMAAAMAEQEREEALCTCAWDSRDGGGAHHYIAPGCPVHGDEFEGDEITQQ